MKGLSEGNQEGETMSEWFRYKAEEPVELFPAGEYLRDELEARGWSHSKFAEIIGCDISVIDHVVSGTERITPEIASLLETGLGVSAQVWMNLEAAYRQANP